MAKDAAKAIGNGIREIREANKWTIEEATKKFQAVRLEINLEGHIDYLKRIEAGKNNVRKVRLKRKMTIENLARGVQASADEDNFEADMELFERVEAGYGDVLITDVQAVALAMGTTVDDLWKSDSTGKPKRKTKKKSPLTIVK